MERRDFIKRLPFAAIGSIMAVEELLSMPFAFKDREFRGTVGIIGAGAAGMYAAKLLREAGVDYHLFEASSLKGGRVRTLNGFSKMPLELGAEFIHGSKSLLYDFVNRRKAIREKEPVKNRDIYIHYDGKVFHGREVLWQKGVLAALRFRNKIEKYTGEDITVADYLKRHTSKFPEKIWPLVNAFISNGEGTCIERMGMYSFAKESQRWHSGDDDYNATLPLMDILEDEIGAASNGDKIAFNCPIREIDHSGSKIILTDDKGQKHEVDKLIVTVSLNVLKSGDIKFTPALPAEKQKAIATIGMDGGMKLLLKFKEPFVKSGPVSLITDGAIPMMWRSRPDVYTVFVMGKKAEEFSSLGAAATESLVMDQMNKVFGGLPGRLLSDFYVQDWLKEPFVKGGYSYATPGTEGQREVLARPVGGKLFFAGEATHTNGHNATVHGAMETGLQAVKQLLEAKEK